MITSLIFVYMNVVSGGRKCLVNFSKKTLQLKSNITVQEKTRNDQGTRSLISSKEQET
jgi:hypothetical protein